MNQEEFYNKVIELEKKMQVLGGFLAPYLPVAAHHKEGQDLTPADLERNRIIKEFQDFRFPEGHHTDARGKEVPNLKGDPDADVRDIPIATNTKGKK